MTQIGRGAEKSLDRKQSVRSKMTSLHLLQTVGLDTFSTVVMAVTIYVLLPAIEYNVWYAPRVRSRQIWEMGGSLKLDF